jgi:hypothetical protein
MKHSIEVRLKQNADGPKKVDLLKSMTIVCDSVCSFSKRYAKLARELQSNETDESRKNELGQIADICDRVPEKPARTFWEALQSFWFIHLALNLETNGYAIGPGRLDQYLYPFYKRDFEEERVTRDHAKELIRCLWIKFNELTVAKEGETAKGSTSYNDFQNVNLAAQGVTGTQTSQTRVALAQQVQAIQSQLISLANTQVGNTYVFGGDAPQSVPYTADTNNPDVGGGVVEQTVTQASRQIEDPLGNTFSVDLTAQQIFDDQNPDGTPASDNVFVAVNQLRVALQNNDVNGIQNSIDAITQADDYLNNQLGFYGAAQNRVAAATNLAQSLALDYQTALSDKQDADLTQAITELTQTQIQEQATLQARAQTPRTSLFDYLPPGA